MRRANKWLMLLLAVIMVASLGLAGCGKDNTSDKPKDNGSAADPNKDEPALDADQTLNYNLGEEPTSLDSTLATYSQDFEILNNLEEGLTRVGKDGKTLEGGIAEKWDVSDDKLTYTFHLRDAKWSNGDPVTANDFEYGWKLALNPKTGSQYAFIFGTANIVGANDFNMMDPNSSDADLKAAADKVGVKALDEKTLEVKLSAPSAFFLDLTAFNTFFPVNQKFFESLQPGEYGTDPAKMIYNGPFTLAEWNHDQSIKFEKNANYWDAETVKLTTINYSIVTDQNTAFNLYLSGDIDSTPVPEQYLSQYKDDPNAQFVPETRTFWFYTNLKGKGVQGEYLKNKNFREALATSIDRKQFVEVTSGGQYAPAYNIVSPGISSESKSEDFIKKYAADDIIKEDAAKAKELLATATKEVGKPLPKEFEFLIGDTDLALKMAQVIQEQWKQLGVNVRINPQPSKIQKELRKSGKFDLSFNGWGADYNDPSTFLDLYTADNPFNELGYNDPEYDKLVKGAAKEPDEAKRMQMLGDAQKVLVNSYSIIPLYHRASFKLRAPHVHDVAYYTVGADVCFKWAYVKGK